MAGGLTDKDMDRYFGKSRPHEADGEFYHGSGGHKTTKERDEHHAKFQALVRESGGEHGPYHGNRSNFWMPVGKVDAFHKAAKEAGYEHGKHYRVKTTATQHAEEEHYPQLAAKHGYGEPKWYKGMSTYVHPDGHAFVVNQKGKWTHSSNKAEHSSGNSPNELSHHLSKFHGEGSQHSEVDGQPNHVTAQDAEALFASNPVIKK